MPVVRCPAPSYHHRHRHKSLGLPIVVPSLIPAIFVRVVYVVIEALNVSDPATGPVGSLFWRILHVLDVIVKAVLDPVVKAAGVVLNVLWDVFDLFLLASSPVRGFFRGILDVILNAVFVLIPVVVFGRSQ